MIRRAQRLANDYRFLARKVAGGLATLRPARRPPAPFRVGPVSALRSYSIWFRHLGLARKNGFRAGPSVVLELGPGNTLGAGLVALLSGSERLYALDALRLASGDRDAEALGAMADLVRERATVPTDGDLPALDDPLTPSKLIPPDVETTCLAPERLAGIEQCLRRGAVGPTGPITYAAPWQFDDSVPTGAVDFLFSQSVLEYAGDPAATYRSLFRCLKPGGFASHFLDFGSIGFAPTWDGHWGYRSWTWRLIKGRRSYIVNRLPCSEHVRLMTDAGFRIVHVTRHPRAATFPRHRLAPEFRAMSEEDRTTEYALVQAVKPS